MTKLLVLISLDNHESLWVYRPDLGRDSKGDTQAYLQPRWFTLDEEDQSGDHQ